MAFLALSLIISVNVVNASVNPAGVSDIKSFNSDIKKEETVFEDITLENNNMAVLVSSCDRYAALWKPFFYLLFKQWPEIKHPVYLISGDLTYSDSRVKSISIQNEKSWSDSMLIALEKIPERYVMLFLEDYWLNSKVDVDAVERYQVLMEKEKLGFISLYVQPYPLKPHDTDSELGYMGEMQPYRTSLNVGIWDKLVLKSLLKSGENPWSFEIQGSIRSRETSEPFLSISGKSPLSYYNAAHRGKLMPEMRLVLENEGLHLPDLSMPYQSKFERASKYIRGLIGNKILTPIKKLIGYEGNLLPSEW